MLANVLCALAIADTTSKTFTPARAKTISVLLKFSPETDGESQALLTNIKPGFQFDEVIPSWNLENSEQTAIRIELRINKLTKASSQTPKTNQTEPEWLLIADWTLDPSWSPRESRNGQSNRFARIATDTLKVKGLASTIDLRVSLRKRPSLGGLEAKSSPPVKMFALSFVNSETVQSGEPLRKHRSWGKTIDVPERAQGNYPRGNVLCSATSSSMLLAYWAGLLNRPELDKDVPEVEASVWDPVYKGAGNWPFNTAYVGSFVGMRGFVARLTSIRDLEHLIAEGIPVACSVSFDMLRGRELSPTESGHLVLVVGFEKDGTPIFNDPAFKAGVRKTYIRQDFEKAWNYSQRTVYIVYPEQISPRFPRCIVMKS